MHRGIVSSIEGNDNMSLPWEVEFRNGEALLTVSDVAAAEQLLAAWAPEFVVRLEVVEEERDPPQQPREARHATQQPMASWKKSASRPRSSSPPLHQKKPCVQSEFQPSVHQNQKNPAVSGGAAQQAAIPSHSIITAASATSASRGRQTSR